MLQATLTRAFRLWRMAALPAWCTLARRRLAVVFLAALAVRLALWVSIFPTPDFYERGDAGEYLALARNLWSGGGITYKWSNLRIPISGRTPGYPIFLAAHRMFSESPRWPALTQVFLDAGTAVIVAMCAAELFPAAPAWAAGLAYGLEPVAAAQSLQIFTETLCAFLLALALWLLVRSGREGRTLPAMGWVAALSAAAMTRPTMVSLCIPWSAALWFLWGRRRPRRLALCVLAAHLLPALWCCRNLAVFGRFGINAPTGSTYLDCEAIAITAAVKRIPYRAAREKVLAAVFPTGHAGFFAEPFREYEMHQKFAFRLMRAHPLAMLRVHAAGAVKLILS